MRQQAVIIQKVLAAVIRSLFIILILITSNKTFAQKKIRPGEYFIKSEKTDIGQEILVSTKYKFNDNQTFERETLGHLGHLDYGKGSYTITDDYLILNYNSAEIIPESYDYKKAWINDSDSVSIKFKVLNITNKPLYGANVFAIYEDSISKSYKLKYGGIVNNEGILDFKVKRNEPSELFTISFLGYKEHKTLVNFDKNYEITVFLKEDYLGNPILDYIDSLKLKKIRPKYFEIINSYGNTIQWRRSD